MDGTEAVLRSPRVKNSRSPLGWRQDALSTSSQVVLTRSHTEADLDPYAIGDAQYIAGYVRSLKYCAEASDIDLLCDLGFDRSVCCCRLTGCSKGFTFPCPPAVPDASSIIAGTVAFV